MCSLKGCVFFSFSNSSPSILQKDILGPTRCHGESVYLMFCFVLFFISFLSRLFCGCDWSVLTAFLQD